jgi:hypothetical protein
MTYEQFAIILGSIYDENLFCFRCKNPEPQTLCKLCIRDLGMHHCNGCNGLYFHDETCSICNCDAEQLDDDHELPPVRGFNIAGQDFIYPESEQLDDDDDDELESFLHDNDDDDDDELENDDE